MRWGTSMRTPCSCSPDPFPPCPAPQPEEGRFALEDLSARVPVDLAGAEQTMGVFTQNCLVVAEGELTAAGVFKVGGLSAAQGNKQAGGTAGRRWTRGQGAAPAPPRLCPLASTPRPPTSPPSRPLPFPQVCALGMPPPERRADSLQALQGLDFFGGAAPDERQLVAWEVRRLLRLPAPLRRQAPAAACRAAGAGGTCGVTAVGHVWGGHHPGDSNAPARPPRGTPAPGSACCRAPALAVCARPPTLAAQARHAEDRLVLLSDCWLDRPEVMDRLATVFEGRGRAGVVWV